MSWPCGDCGTKWPDAVPTCITCLRAERDVLEAALREVEKFSHVKSQAWSIARAALAGVTFADLARAARRHVDSTEETPADREAEALRRCASYPATSSDAEAVAFADADYVLRWLEQTNAPANIIGLQRRVRAALAGVTDTKGE